MEKIRWCLEKGMELIEPNDNLCNAYLAKAKQAVRVMKRNEGEWKVIAGYYATYNSIYALLMKIGVESRIHSCTIEIARRFLDFEGKDIEMIKNAKEGRERVQYHIIRPDELQQHLSIVEKASVFMQKCETKAKELDEKKIEHIRKTISNAL